jgi:ribonuclease HI
MECKACDLPCIPNEIHQIACILANPGWRVDSCPVPSRTLETHDETVNRAELRALTHATILAALFRNIVTIYTDSAYAISAWNNKHTAGEADEDLSNILHAAKRQLADKERENHE